MRDTRGHGRSCRHNKHRLLSVWGQVIIYVPIIVIFVSRGMFLKGMDDRFILSKDERLTPNIDEVMADCVI